MSVEYAWRDGASAPSVDPQVAGETLERIRIRNGGVLRPRDVVDEARAKNHPLHDVFEWDDAAAAEQHRLQQARHMTAKITVRGYTEQHNPQRAFVNVAPTREDQGYLSTLDSDEAVQDLIREQALRDLESWHRRYSELEDFARVVGAIKATVRKLRAA